MPNITTLLHFCIFFFVGVHQVNFVAHEYKFTDPLVLFYLRNWVWCSHTDSVCVCVCWSVEFHMLFASFCWVRARCARRNVSFVQHVHSISVFLTPPQWAIKSSAIITKKKKFKFVSAWESLLTLPFRMSSRSCSLSLSHTHNTHCAVADRIYRSKMVTFHSHTINFMTVVRINAPGWCWLVLLLPASVIASPPHKTRNTTWYSPQPNGSFRPKAHVSQFTIILCNISRVCRTVQLQPFANVVHPSFLDVVLA